MKKLLSALIMGGLLLGLTAAAQDAATTEDSSVNGLKLGVGLSYRNFHTVRLHGTSQRGTEGYAIGAPAVAGLYTDANQVTSSALSLPAYKMSSDGYSTHTHGKFGFGEQLSPVLSASSLVWQDDNFTVEAIANFQFFNMNTNQYAQATERFRYFETRWINNKAMMGITADNQFATVINPKYSELAVARNDGKISFDLQLYVLDLGLKANYTFADNFDIFAAAGPSLSIADMESHSYAHSDNDTEWILGFYASVGGNYMFTESLGLSLEARYDEAFKHANTHYGNLNLDSWSTLAKLNFLF